MKIIVGFKYGSVIYGTNDKNSDIDAIFVVDNFEGFNYHVWETIEHTYDDKHENIIEIRVQQGNIDYHFITEERFLEMIKKNDIRILEAFSDLVVCTFNSNDYKVLEKYKEKFVLNPTLVREEISSICSNSWVKAKKKLTVEADYNSRIAKKSLWHVLRLYMFGIQLGKYGKIVDFTEANKYYKDIMDSPNVWESCLKKKYQPIRNKLHSEFKKYFPLEVK